MFGKNKENSFQVNLIDGSSMYLSEEDSERLEQAIIKDEKIFKCENPDTKKKTKIVINKVVFMVEV